MVVNDNGKLKFCFWFDSHAREKTTREVGDGEKGRWGNGGDAGGDAEITLRGDGKAVS